MPSRGPRIQRKFNPQKRGRKGYSELAKLPRRAGLKKRSQFRKNKKKSRCTMKRYRTFFRYMFTLSTSRRYLIRSCKGLRPPGAYDKANHHGGVMPALPGDFELSSVQAGEILDKVGSTKGVSYDQLRGVSGMLPQCSRYL